MFKRLRDNLLGRGGEPLEPEPPMRAPEEAQTESAEAEVIPQVPASGKQNRMEAVSAEIEMPLSPSSEGAINAGAGPSLAPPAQQVDDGESGIDVYDDLGVEETGPARGGIFRNPFRLGLGRTRQLFGRVSTALEESDEITDDLWDELEETLISSDVGVTTTERLMGTLRERVEAEHLMRGSQLRDALKDELALLLGDPEPLVFSDSSTISVYLVVGVNGVGKTTSIAKMANLLKRQKHRVMLAAGDTFRAAATEQIRTWGERIGVPVVSHQHGADPGAVVYDAMQAAQARGADVLIVDTAGRLHTKFNLMEELKKIMRVLQKYDPEAPHEVLLVVDATTGQNGFLQAKQFVQDSGVSGVILTKLDGTARGGIVFAIASELGLPIKFIGTGEKVGDIAPFDPDAFVDALFEEE